jgi:hypothetical protein
MLAFAVALSLTSCNAQEKKGNAEHNDTAMKNNTSTALSNQNQQEPHGTWKVNKEVDENGNLVRYDSIYQYSYGNINGKQVPARKMDSVMASFQKYMQARMPRAFSQGMMNPFESDSLNTDFFENGFFQNHWEDFFPEMQQQLKQMDSLHQQFFQQNQPGLFPPEEKKQKS